MRITIDNNFFEHYQQLNTSDKNIIDKCFSAKIVTLYITRELLAELWSLYEKDKEKCCLFCSYVIQKSNLYRIFLPLNDIYFNELFVSYSFALSVFEGNKLQNKFFTKIQDLSNKKIPNIKFSKIPEVMRDTKGKQYKDFIEAKEINKQIAIIKRDAGKNFNDFIKNNPTFLDCIRKKGIKEIIEIYKNKLEPNKRVSSNSGKKQYFDLHVLSLAALIYLHALGEGNGIKVESGDNFDRNYLCYTPGLDFLISNDKKIKKIEQTIQQIDNNLPNKVINIDEFVGKCKEKYQSMLPRKN